LYLPFKALAAFCAAGRNALFISDLDSLELLPILLNARLTFCNPSTLILLLELDISCSVKLATQLVNLVLQISQ